MEYFFAWVGVICSVCIVVFIIAVIFAVIKEFVNNQIHKHKYKHRFDKPPIAKCYCRDCVQWDHSTGKCHDPCNSRYMGAGWFCCFAEPVSKEVMIIREKDIKNREVEK